MSSFDGWTLSDEFWKLFFGLLLEMSQNGLLPEDPSKEDAELFFAYLAALMIERATEPMPSLDDTILIVNHMLAKELPGVIAKIDEMISDE